jgi:hypothetical protein
VSLEQEYECKPGSLPVEFKFANEAPVVFIYRRVLLWGEKPFWKDSFGQMSTRPASSEVVGGLYPDASWSASGDEFSTKFSQALMHQTDSSYLLAELWIWSTWAGGTGWCLKRSIKSWDNGGGSGSGGSGSGNNSSNSETV